MSFKLSVSTWLVAVLAMTARAQIDPLNVHVVGHWDEHPANYTAADHWADDQGYAYVCNRTGATIDVMDISDPSNPTLVTIYEIGPPNNFTNAKEAKVANGLMFIGLDDDGFDGVEVVDVRDPTNPQFLVNITIPGYPDVHNLFYDRGYLYLADGRDETLAVVDLTEFDPDNPPESTITEAKWELNNVGTALVHDLTVQDGLLYASAWGSGIWVYDISDIENQPPIFLGSAAGDNTHSAWPTKDKRWIVTNEERCNGGPVKLYEMTPSADGIDIQLRDTFAIPTEDAPASHNVYVVGYRAYCAWYNRGLMGFDIDPVSKSLNLVAHYDVTTETSCFRGAWGIFPFFGRDKVLMSAKTEQFWIFDVRVPGSGDFNGDADVDLADFAGMQLCFSGSDVLYGDDQCEIFDFDGDGDVDYDDLAEHVAAYSGPR